MDTLEITGEPSDEESLYSCMIITKSQEVCKPGVNRARGSVSPPQPPQGALLALSCIT